MQFWTFNFAEKFPALFRNCRMPIKDIPVLHDGDHLCYTSLKPIGFPLVIPLPLALMLSQEEAYIEPITRTLDSGQMEITGLQIRIAAEEPMPELP